MSMALCSFAYGARFQLSGREYVVRKQTDDTVEVCDTRYQRVEAWQLNELLEAWRRGELLFEVLGGQNDKPASLPREVLDLLTISEDLKKEALSRLSILEPLLKGEVHPSQIPTYARTVNVSPATLYRWKTRFEHGGDIRYLIPRRMKRGPNTHRTVEDTMKILEGTLDDLAYQGVDKSDEELYAEFLLRLDDANKYRDATQRLSDISLTTFRRRKKEVLNRRRMNRATHGSHAAALMEEGVQQTIIVTRPLQRVEIDSTPTDVMLFDPKTLKAKRGHLVYAIDAFGSMPLGFKLTMDAPTAADVKECLLHCMTPKTYMRKEFPFVEHDWIAFGKPNTLVLDNASVNDSYELEDICQYLGIRLQFAKVAAGNQKPRIERGFRTLNQKWMHGSWGTTKSNVIARARYDSEGNACISPQMFVKMAHLVLTDLVAHAFNRGVGMTPHEKWQQGWRDNPHLQNPLSRTFEELQFLLITGHEKRILQNIGVEISGQQYNSPELMRLRSKLTTDGRDKERVTVRFGDSDMRAVFVLNPYTKEFIRARAIGLEKKELDPELPVPHIALEQNKAEVNNNRRKADSRDRGKAERTLQSLGKEAKEEKRHAQRSGKISEPGDGATNDSSKLPSGWDVPRFNVSERRWELPSDHETISDIEEDNDYYSKRGKGKTTPQESDDSRVENEVSLSHELSEDDLEDMDVSFK